MNCPKGHPDARYVGNAISGKRMYACHHAECRDWFFEGDKPKPKPEVEKPTKPKRKGRTK